MSVRFAVLGAGRIGQVHARAISSVEGATLVAIAEPLEAAAETARATFQVDIRSIEDCAGATDVDAVVICTPTDTHADLIEAFVRAGKAVFCEKPVDLSVARVRACLDVVTELGGQLMVGFNRRFDPDFRALKAAIDGGRIGEVEMVAITSRDPGPPPIGYIERSGGLFKDMTIHDFDIARWLLGEDVDRVLATGSNLVDPAIGQAGDIDSASVILMTTSGKHCAISNSRRAVYGYDQRIEVHGSEGMVSAQNMAEAAVTVATEAGFAQPPLVNFFMDRYQAAYAAEIEAFVGALASGAEMPTTGHDGLMALALAEAAMRSAADGRVVQLSEMI
ncbi:MAG: inositol 2-dehydrogenase [Pseudomonadota bacterium]